jgi:glycosyltransferase involved in cell wall biosynthesis
LCYLSANGIKYKVYPFVSPSFHKILYKKGYILRKCLYTIGGFFRRILNIIESLKYDLVFIYREAAPLGPPLFEKLLELMGRAIIYDFDDAIYLPSSSEANRFAGFFKFPRKTNFIVKMSKLILAGNRNLASYASGFNKNVSILPTAIDTELYQPKAYSDNDKVCVGWSGSITTIAHLNLLSDVLRELYRRHQIIIKVIGSREFNIPGIEILAQDWRAESELNDLAQIDIGLMPLPDDEWGKGKCGLKALQYMALGIPTVCSPVGVNKEIIADGINGFLCKDSNEWFNKISVLINDSNLRYKMGQAGRETVEEKYSVEVNAPKFLDAIQRAYNEK